ncbi:MAG: hypothetical protein MUE81_06905 [Thermoflexibacter sp.]|nr:hypothetical protein [Thermoflexibacter sp.]
MKTLVKFIFVITLFIGTLSLASCNRSEDITPDTNRNRVESDTCRRN